MAQKYKLLSCYFLKSKNDDEERDVARAQLDQYFTEMDAFVPPFYQALDLQYNASSQDSPWAKMGQVMIADLEAGEESQLNVILTQYFFFFFFCQTWMTLVCWTI